MSGGKDYRLPTIFEEVPSEAKAGVSPCGGDDAALASEGADVKVPCEVYSRIVGYLRPVQAWNDAKRQEFDDRRVFDVGALTQ